VYQSGATNLVAGDTNSSDDVFLYDALNATTVRISLANGGGQGSSNSFQPFISPDGRYVVFESFAPNLVANDTNGRVDVFVRDLLNATTTLISQNTLGVIGDDDSNYAVISASGQFVVFHSFASNFVAGDGFQTADVFVRDLVNGTTECVSVDGTGAPGDAPSGYYYCSISDDGRFVGFDSSATNLVAADTNGFDDVFVRDRVAGTTELVSVGAGGQGDLNSNSAAMSADGRLVVFWSTTTNLVAGDTNGVVDSFIRDRQSGTTERISLSTGGGQGNGDSPVPAINRGGRYVVFLSNANNLVAGDTNGVTDLFLRDRGPVSPGTDICQPGVGGIASCPCSNPPSGTPRGCDNSSTTGGAQLTSNGLA
jgi:Tol biopolymer transport system component